MADVAAHRRQLQDGEIRVLVVSDPKNNGAFQKHIVGPSVTLIGQCGFGTEAIVAAQENSPNVIVVSLDEPLARSFRTIESLSVAQPNSPIVAVTPSGDRELPRKAVRAGARDYIALPLGHGELAKTIRAVYEAEQKRLGIAAPDAGKSVGSGELYVVCGAKGGIGKTTLAVNLASAIAAATKEKVALVDLDIHNGDIALLLDIVPEHGIVEAALNADRLEPDFLMSLAYTDASGVHIFSAPTSLEEMTDVTAEQIGRVLDLLGRMFDYVVVDTAPTFTDITLTAIDRATASLLVTTPELSALKRTKLALSLLLQGWHFPDERIRLVLNWPSPHRNITVTDIENTLRHKVYWEVIYDPTVEDAVRLGRPCVENKPVARFSQNTMGLARELCGIKPPKKGLFAKLFRR